MSATLTRPKKQKPAVPPHISHSPNYIVLLPPGHILKEKMEEMGIDIAELAARMEESVETVEKLFCAEIALTEPLAEKIERATRMPGLSPKMMMRHESDYKECLAFSIKHPEFPAYLGGRNIHETAEKRQRKKTVAMTKQNFDGFPSE